MYLLDTNALSEPLRKAPSARFMDRLRRAPAAALFTSAICVFELRFGAERRGGGLWKRIEEEILDRLGVVAVDRRVAERAADLRAHLAGRGTPVALEDLLIGATALAEGMIVVTRNVRDFERLPGVHVENWHA